MSGRWLVPFVNLHAEARTGERGDVLAAVHRVIDSGEFIGGPVVAEFEEAWAAYCDAPYCVGVSSGTDALVIALRALSLPAGSRVAVPALTFVATWEACVLVGLYPVGVDVRDDDYCINPSLIPENVYAVIPVDMYGRLASPDDVAAAFPPSETPALVVDACQAHGRPVPASVAAAAFSFYPTKNLGAYGDAGALVTHNGTLAQRFRELRDHGQAVKNRHSVVGHTARLDAVQAAVLLAKLLGLREANARRAYAAGIYQQSLADVPGVRLPPLPRDGDVWHLYTIRVADPDGLAAFLAARGVGTGRHYPVPPPLQPAYEPLGYQPGDFPVAERVAAETLSLPLWPGITRGQQDEVVAAIRAYMDGADG